MTKSAPTPSSFLAWLEAGAELMTAQLAQVTDSVNKQFASSHQLTEELQRRGEEIDAHLRHSLTPAGAVSTVQDIMLNNPVYKRLAANAKAARQREQQLDLLLVKVDLLIEQVSLLSDNEGAVEKKDSNNTSSSVGENKNKDNDVPNSVAPVGENKRKATRKSKPVASSRTQSNAKKDT